ncbi:MAG: U32 family peptidase, partial [Ignavibacteria bacterium]|nr:U32 family peptidase [Ignavibacteria bacterium]
KATEEKTYKGKVTNYFSRIGVAEISLDAGELKKGERILFTGEKTGIVFGAANDIRIDGKSVDAAPQRSIISVKVDERVRRNDLFYVVSEKTNQQDYSYGE